MSTHADVGALPKWDLSDLFPGPDAPELEAALADCRAEAQRLQGAYEGKLAGLDGDAFGEAITAYESFQEAIGRILSYANLHHSAALDDPKAGKFAQDYSGAGERYPYTHRVLRPGTQPYRRWRADAKTPIIESSPIRVLDT